jgi:hypothetical protein
VLVQNQIDISKLDLSLQSLRNDEPFGNAVRPMVTTVNDGIQRIQQFLSGRLQNGRVDMIYIMAERQFSTTSKKRWVKLLVCRRKQSARSVRFQCPRTHISHRSLMRSAR